MLRNALLSCLVILLVACNNNGEEVTSPPAETTDTTITSAKKEVVIVPCDFVSSRKKSVPLEKQSILPNGNHFQLDTNYWLDEETYNSIFRASSYFDEDYSQFKWFMASQANGFGENVMLVTYERNDEFGDQDAFLFLFNGDCEIVDALLISTYRTFNGGSTQKSAYFESDTLTVGTVVSNKAEVDHEESSDINYRMYYHDKELEAFMLAEN